VLANLLELYVHDFSEFHPVELGADGRFGYKHLSRYWDEPDHHPFLITVDNNLAGLALVQKGSQVSDDSSVWDLAEFFIVRAYRRRGIGITAAQQVWNLFPGRWEVRVMESNMPAFAFWQRAISSFVGGQVALRRTEKANRQWHLFAFDVPPLRNT